MNLYLCSQTVNSNYDTFDAIVVAAKNEDQARTIHPLMESAKRYKVLDTENSILPMYLPGVDWWNNKEYRPWDWVKHPDQVEVKLIGIADESITEPTVILASFNAG